MVNLSCKNGEFVLQKFVWFNGPISRYMRRQVNGTAIIENYKFGSFVKQTYAVRGRTV